MVHLAKTNDDKYDMLWLEDISWFLSALVSLLTAT